MNTKTSAHTHVYGPHPTWIHTHVACQICGMAIPVALLPAAINAGAKVVDTKVKE